MPRPPLGPSIVDRLEGPQEPKKRLKLVLEVNAQRKTVEEACAELGASAAVRFQGPSEPAAPEPVAAPEAQAAESVAVG